MEKMTNYDKTKNLREYATKKSKMTKRKVEQAIEQLQKENQEINFNSVAKVAGVSKPYLYGNLELRSKIESLREKNSNSKKVKVKKNMLDDNKDALIIILRNKIKELEDENKELKSKLQKRYSDVYDNI